MKKILFIVLALLLILCGCSETETVYEYSIRFSERSMSIRAGYDEELSYSMNFSSDLTWISDNENIAKVEDGFVTGVNAGSTKISVFGVVDGKTYSDTIEVTVTSKGPAVFTVTIGDNTYNLAAGKPVSALLISLYGKTYEQRDGYAFDGWYIDPNCTVEFDVKQTLDKNISIFPKYRVTTDIVGTPMPIDTVLKYGKGKVTDLGNVFTVSPAYDKDLTEYDFTGYTVLSLRYNIEKEKYEVIEIQQNSFEVPFDGFLLGIKNSYEKVDEFLSKLTIGTFVDLDTYSVNTAKKLYFDRKMDSGSVNEVDSVKLGCSFASAYDMTYGKELYNKSGDAKAYPASTTKVITAIAALKYASLDDTYTIGSELDVMNEGSSPSLAGLKKGQVWTLRQLLYATLLPSGNDAAYSVTALTMDVKEPGNTYTAREKMDKFAELMNEVALECGATNSHFMVPDGNSYYKHGGSASVPSLWDDRLTYHYVTANDMVKIAKYAFKIGGLAEVTSTASVSFKIVSGESYSFTNTNQLLRPSHANHYEGCVGLKTGTTTPAGGCLISGVELDGRFVIVAILKSNDRYADSRAMYDAIYK